MSNIIETPRLILRVFTLDDTGFIIALLNTPGWIEFIGDRNVHTPEAAKNYLLNGPVKSYGENGFGLWMVASRTDNQPVGMCGILKRDHLNNPDIGFAFLPEMGNKGYAFEAASATLQYATGTLQLHTIEAITLPANRRSVRLLEKLGLKYKERFFMPGDPEELLLYSTPPVQTNQEI